jgi:hypothetical protein
MKAIVITVPAEPCDHFQPLFGSEHENEPAEGGRQKKKELTTQLLDDN